MARLILALIAVFLFSGVPSDVGAQDIADKLAQPRTHLIIRHAMAPGTGDPENFKIENCSTQRNLDQEGRAQARVIGENLKNKDIRFDAIYSSQWCRCIHTAELIDMGEVRPLPSLNSIWTKSQRLKEKQSASLKEILLKSPPQNTFLLVTHYANILALTGRSTGSGNGFVIRVDDNGVKIVERFEFDLP